MKKAFPSIIKVCIAFIIFSTACKKNENIKPILTASAIEPANLSNPYDSFGYWHNVILDSIERQRSLGHCAGLAGSCNYIRKFYIMKNWPELSGNQFERVPKTTNDASSNIYGLIDSSRWDDSVKARLKQLVEEMETSPAESFSKLKIAITRFEEGIFKSNLPTTDKEALLKIASVARHSSFRWMQRNNMKQPDRKNTLYSAKFLGGFGRWIAITMADIGGAVAELSIANATACSDYMSQLMAL